MIPYLLVFCSSILCCVIGEVFLKKNKYIAYIWFLLAVLIVASMAGLRDFTVGTDITTYGEYEFEAARKSSNLFQLIIERRINVEPFYTVLNYIVTRFTDNSHWLYFIIGMIVYGFTMLGLLNYRQAISISCGWMCFLLIFYSDTLNAMRQSIAMAILFWGFYFAIQKKYVKYSLTVMVAFMFHNTAIISFGIFLLYWILCKKDSVVFKSIMVLGAVIVTILYSYILEFLMDIGIFTDKYQMYLMEGGFGFEIKPILIRLPMVLLIWLYKEQFKRFYDDKNKTAEGSLYIMLLIIEIVLMPLRSIVPALYRISFYFGYYKIVAYSRLYQIVKRNEKVLTWWGICGLLTIIWIYQNVIQGANEIYPFTSEIIGIR